MYTVKQNPLWLSITLPDSALDIRGDLLGRLLSRRDSAVAFHQVLEGRLEVHRGDELKVISNAHN